VLFIPSSKTDQAGDIRKAPLFRRVITHFNGSIGRIGSVRLHANSIALIYHCLIRAAWEKLLLGEMSEAEFERWLKAVSSHSIRFGVAQDNFSAGGRVDLDSNVVERSIRPLALNRKNALFAGSDEGGDNWP
jgi:hypothetical protein